MIKAFGGTVVGDVRAPLGTSDLSSYLVQAQASGADVVATANGGDDVVNTVKQAAEFGVIPKQRLAGLLVFLTDVEALGLQSAQGLLLTEAFLLGPQRQHAGPGAGASPRGSAARCRP